MSSINLSKYISGEYTKDPIVEYAMLGADIYSIVQAMDNLIDENLDNHALEEQKNTAIKWRNIGVGTMGIADLFIKMGIKYGSNESIELAREIHRFIFRTAILASSHLATTRGSFPGYSDKIWESTIIKNHFSELEINDLKTQGLRNCALLSIAPTGSIGTMLETSTGMEPHFAISYKRRTESLNKEGDKTYDVYIKEASNYLSNIGDTLPEYFISASDIHYIDRIRMQGAIQESVDTAISSTINLPKDTSIQDIEDIYYNSWKIGLKGVTVYVDGSRDPILSTGNTDVKDKNRQAPKRPSILEADFHLIKAKGEQFVVLVGLYDNSPYEIFAFRNPYEKELNIPKHRGKIVKIKKGHYTFDSEYIQLKDLQLANDLIEERAATITASLALRSGVKIPHIVKTYKKVNENIVSFSSAMCRILSIYIQDGFTEERCPKCNSRIHYTNGCKECSRELDPVCVYSKCG